MNAPSAVELRTPATRTSNGCLTNPAAGGQDGLGDRPSGQSSSGRPVSPVEAATAEARLRALEKRNRLSGAWSRRITEEHRLVYVVDGDDLMMLQARLHDE